MKIEKLVPDTSVIIEGLVSQKIKLGEIKPEKILVHEAVLSELEHQANLNKAKGYLGLEELQKLRSLATEKGFELAFVGRKPTASEIKHSDLGEIDSLIRDLAFEEDAVLLTADKIQARTAEIKGVKVFHLELSQVHKKLKLEQFFDETTMSVHLRENIEPNAKKGVPGNWKFLSVRAKPLTREEVQEISREIIEEAGIRKDGFIEIERPGSTIVQLGVYRIVITKPPFSDGWEITAVRPVKRLTLNDYKLSDKLSQRVKEHAEGILIAGAPGMGKCHGKGTPILMYDGSIRRVEDIKAGDEVMGPDSQPRTVLGTAMGFGRLYKVSPTKGDSFVVNEHHMLSLKYNMHGTEKTVNVCAKDFLKLPNHLQSRYKGYRTGVEFPRKQVPIDPYFLGVWLGDGLSASSRVANSETEVLNFLNEYAHDNGLVLKQHSFNTNTACQTYAITTGYRGGKPSNQLVLQMKSLHLIQNKHIPNIYQINDREIRLQVLAGLVDTDGYLCFNCYEICTKYEALKEDILYLARSLGFAAYSKEKFVKDRKYFRIRISGEISLIPTKVKRKMCHKRQQVKNILRTGIKLEDAGYGEYYGFELDKDGLYCLGDFTVTHNSTFAQALAEFYADQGRIVKTVEAPRDLILKDNITQYAISHGDAQEIHDVLLLSRPDNTIFDEMRNTSDFQLFADLRLAGIGLAGVVHATNPIDAIQRFVGRIELGVIPQVIDTVIFIKNGQVSKVLSLQMVVKVPSGMTEADLARPVVVVNDFETKKLEYELYSYGEETVVVPVQETARPAAHQIAARAIEQEVRKICADCEVELVSDQKCILRVPKNEIAGIIGKQGKNIDQLERRLGISIDVQELEKPEKNASVDFESQITKNAVQFFLSTKYQAKDVEIFIGGDYLLSAKVGKAGIIKISKNNKIGRILVDAINSGEKVEIFI